MLLPLNYKAPWAPGKGKYSLRTSIYLLSLISYKLSIRTIALSFKEVD